MKKIIFFVLVLISLILSSCNPRDRAPQITSSYSGETLNTFNVSITFYAGDDWDKSLEYKIFIEGELVDFGEMGYLNETGKQVVFYNAIFPYKSEVNVSYWVKDDFGNIATHTDIIKMNDTGRPYLLEVAYAESYS